MNEKMKECFTPHAMMHNLMGLGIGILLVSVIPSLGVWWIGVIVVIVAMVLDYIRK